MAGNQNSGRNQDDQNQGRGLASADEETKQRVASEGGSSHDEEFFSEIGKKGGQASQGGASSDDQSSGEGQGWHGDPEGHAEAGRQGGEE